MGRDQVVINPPVIIDLTSAADLEAELGAVPTGVDVVVDCSSVEFMDSTGLRVILAAHDRQEAAGGSVQVASPTRMVRRLFEITDLAGMIRD